MSSQVFGALMFVSGIFILVCLFIRWLFRAAIKTVVKIAKEVD